MPSSCQRETRHPDPKTETLSQTSDAAFLTPSNNSYRHRHTQMLLLCHTSLTRTYPAATAVHCPDIYLWPLLTFLRKDQCRSRHNHLPPAGLSWLRCHMPDRLRYHPLSDFPEAVPKYRHATHHMEFHPLIGHTYPQIPDTLSHPVPWNNPPFLSKLTDSAILL